MTAKTFPRAGLGTLLSAMGAALQWRLLLLWLLFLLLPATVVAWPLWRALGGLLDHSMHAGAWARHFDPLMFGDTIGAMAGHAGWLGGTVVLGLALTLLLSPFLDGMVIGSGRAGRVLGFGALLQNGWVEYGRMFRVLLWSLLPYLVVALVAGVGAHVAAKRAGQTVLESQADAWAHGTRWVLLIAFVLAQAIVESTRAAFIVDTSLHSATRALGRGCMQLLRRPLATLLLYLLVSAVGLLIAAVFGMARIHTTAVGGGFLLDLLFSQLMVVALGWMRIARLFTLAGVARSLLSSPPPTLPPTG